MTGQEKAHAAETAVDPLGRLLAIRHTFLDRLWNGMFVIAAVATPVSVSRALITGWHHVYTLHIALTLLVAGLYFARGAVRYRTKLYILIILFAAVGCSGIFTLGLLGSGIWFLVMCSLLVSTFFSLRTGLIVAVATGLTIILAAVLFITGILKVPFDANVYVTSVTGWAILLISTSIMPFVVFTAFGAYQRTIVDLLHELQQQRDQIADLAARDQLTGLPMASLANDRLEMKMHSAMRDGTRVAFLFVDLNGFKAVNDTWGHEAGDHLLQAVATRLQKSVRVEDTVARVGGDEFVVLLGGLKSRHEAVAVAEKIIANVCQPVIYAAQSITSGASIGISIFPEDATDIATLRRLADRAMYQIKRSGKNGFAFADGEAPMSEIPAGK
ncbi:MAG: diguanylate cyclase [Burkholderiales bacterium]|nr:diguanylate cyclase [Burkholderiales bacterium]